MSEDNVGDCPAYLEPPRFKGTSRDTLGQGTQPCTMALRCPRQPCTFRGQPWGDCRF